jgi:GNAT superfamily N-acetyltransferase
MSADVALRMMLTRDIPEATQLSAEAGWNQTAKDWRTLIDLAPAGCLAIEAGGELAATATLLSYGKQLAWVGMVLTRVRFRGRGFARRLLTETLAVADRMGIETVKLDATDQGQPLYETLGFRCEQAVERWGRPASSPMPGSPISELLASENWGSADRRAFGADRSQLLAKLAERNPPLSIGCSYLLTRPGRVMDYLGPCIADTPTSARTLVERALQATGTRDCAWDLFPNNTHAIAIANDFGFAPKRRLMRMVRGKDLRGEETVIYAIAGFELG